MRKANKNKEKREKKEEKERRKEQEKIGYGSREEGGRERRRDRR